MNVASSYRDLEVWQLGMDMVASAYELTNEFPPREMYGLTSQLRRSAVSVPANIAEGHARDSTKEFLHHISFSMGSLAEVETHLLIAERLKFVQQEQIIPLLELCGRIGRMLRSLQKSLKRKLD